MSGLLAAEWLKLRTVRGTWGYVLTAIALAALVTAGTIGSSSQGDRLADDFQVRIVLDATGGTIILALLLGMVLITNEFRHGTITPSLLVTPRRGRLIAAKLIAGAATGVALTAIAVLVVAAVGVVWLGLVDVRLEVADAIGAAGRVFVAAAVAGALGGAYGCLIHAQVPALVGALVWLLVVEPLLGGLLGLVDAEGVSEFLPGSVIFAIGDPDSGGLSFVPALAAGLAHVFGATALAWVRTDRRDIT